MENFLEKLADILDVDKVKEDNILEDFEEWDSLSVLTIISYIGSTYNKTVTAKEIRTCKTAKDLFDLASA